MRAVVKPANGYLFRLLAMTYNFFLYIFIEWSAKNFFHGDFFNHPSLDSAEETDGIKQFYAVIFSRAAIGQIAHVAAMIVALKERF